MKIFQIVSASKFTRRLYTPALSPLCIEYLRLGVVMEVVVEVWLWLTLMYKRDSPDDPECLLCVHLVEVVEVVEVVEYQMLSPTDSINLSLCDLHHLHHLHYLHYLQQQ